MRLIDAENLAEVLNRYLAQLRNSGISVGLRMGINTCLTFINNANTIEAEPVKRGRWEEYLIPNILCCSNCDWGIDPLCKSPYCPNCGAKMYGDRKEGADNG